MCQIYLAGLTFMVLLALALAIESKYISWGHPMATRRRRDSAERARAIIRDKFTIEDLISESSVNLCEVFIPLVDSVLVFAIGAVDDVDSKLTTGNYDHVLMSESFEQLVVALRKSVPSLAKFSTADMVLRISGVSVRRLAARVILSTAVKPGLIDLQTQMQMADQCSAVGVLALDLLREQSRAIQGTILQLWGEYWRHRRGHGEEAPEGTVALIELLVDAIGQLVPDTFSQYIRGGGAATLMNELLESKAGLDRSDWARESIEGAEADAYLEQLRLFLVEDTRVNMLLSAFVSLTDWVADVSIAGLLMMGQVLESPERFQDMVRQARGDVLVPEGPADLSTNHHTPSLHDEEISVAQVTSVGN